MRKIFVLDTDRKPLTPCSPRRARILLKQGKAAVLKRFPFTIILKYAIPDATPSPLRCKIDPGSKKTGVAIIDDATGDIIFAAEIEHRGQLIHKKMDSRRAIRRSRRNRKTRYRKPRFLNRVRNRELPPSLESRVSNVITWVKRLMRLAPVQALSQELVRFDMQKQENPEISGVDYHQGTLAGYEVREYLLEKWQRKCAYCGKENIPLQIEHIKPKSNGGTDRISNLSLACQPCNQKKGNRSVAQFLAKKPEILKRVLAQAKVSLKDAASVNTTRWVLFNRLQVSGLPVETGSGGLTKFNRTQRNIPKEHWTDAVCVGKSTPSVILAKGVKPLQIKATGHGSRQMCRVDKFGFPRTSAKTQTDAFGFRTGDMVKAVVTTGKKIGTYTGRVVIRASGSFDIATNTGKVSSISHRFFRILQKRDGYNYNYNYEGAALPPSTQVECTCAEENI